MFKMLKKQTGLATDEIILSSVMLASVGTFVAVSVPWDSYFEESSQMMESLTQIEQANLEFYKMHRVWPHQTTSGDWKANVGALVTPKAMRYPYNDISQFKNHIPSIANKYTVSEGIHHDFGNGGTILQRPVSKDGTTYMEVIMENVPVADARKLDRKLDGEYDPDNGRVTLGFSDDKKLTTVYYRANRL